MGPAQKSSVTIKCNRVILKKTVWPTQTTYAWPCWPTLAKQCTELYLVIVTLDYFIFECPVVSRNCFIYDIVCLDKSHLILFIIQLKFRCRTYIE